MSAIEELREAIDELTQSQLKENGPRIFNTEDISELIDCIETEYMELPRDKNGEVIHVGDTVLDGDLSYEVMGVQDSKWLVVCSPNGCGVGIRSAIVEIEHVVPDSIERIKADACKTVREYWQCIDHVCCHEGCLAPRIHNNCDYAKTLDLIARTEKLLGGEQE